MTAPGQLKGPQAGTMDNPYFAVVIGSGFGGAVTACRLAQARAAEREANPKAPPRPILLMERGRRYGGEDFGRLKMPDYLVEKDAEASKTSKRLPETARLFWENDQGLWDLRNLGELRLAQAAGYGGGSLIYANVHLRPPQSVFDDKWKATCDGPCACTKLDTAPPAYSRDGLKPYFERVDAMLDLARVPTKDPPPKTRALKKLAAIAGGDDHFLYPPLAITFSDPPGGKNRFGRPQKACINCGNCTIGCQEGAKNTLDLNYLAVAEDLGVEVRTLSEVQTIRPFQDDARKLLRVTYVDHLAGDDDQVVAEHVFVCAGAAGSTALLHRSGDAAKREEASRAVERRNQAAPTKPLPVPVRLGENFFGNGDAIGVAFGATMDEVGEPLSPTKGPTITGAIVHGGPNWFLLEDGGFPPSIKQALGLLRSPIWGARNRFAAPGSGRKGILVHALAALHAAHGYWLSNATPSPAVAVSRALRQLVPASLDRIVADLAAGAATAQNEINKIVEGTLVGVDPQIPWIFRWLRPILVPKEKVYGPANKATAALHPLTTELLTSNRPMEYVFAILRFLMQGAPVDDDTMLLLCMGPDHAGKLHWKEQRLRIEWNLGPKNLELYDTQERLMRDAAAVLGGELRTNPDWTLGRKPITVHAQGGCGMGGNDKTGVTTPCGRLWTCEQVYVMDGAVLPGSVGVNPSSTIAAVAERNIELFIRKKIPLAGDYSAVFKNGRIPLRPREDFDDSLTRVLPPVPKGVPHAQPVGLSWHEELGGRLVKSSAPDRIDVLDFFADVPPAPKGQSANAPPLPQGRPPAKAPPLDRGHFRGLERRGRQEGTTVVVKLDVKAANLEYLMMEDDPVMVVGGHVTIGEAPRQQSFEVGGWLRLDMMPVPGGKRSSRTWMQPRRLTGMTYKLTGGAGSPIVVGRKVIQDDPGIDFWNDLSTLYTSVRYEGGRLAGILRVHLPDFVNRQLRNMEVGSGLDDDFAKAWGFIRFAQFFFGSMRNAYSDWGTP